MPHLVYLEPVTGYGAVENARRLDLLRASLRAGFTIELMNPPDGPKILEHPGDFEQARSAARVAVSRIKPEACGAIIAAGAVDPGLQNLRAVARVPVIGPGEASLFLAGLLGSRLAILTIEPAAAAARDMIQNVQARPEVVMVRSMKTTVRKILANLDEGRQVIRHEAAAAVREDKADVIYLGAMTLGTLGITQELATRLGVPVIDPLPVSVHAAQEAAAARGA